MQTIHRLADLRDRTRVIRQSGDRIALVPTMGALHDGHMSLVQMARAHADHVAVSIFVNPKQFGPTEDFDAYPRPAAADVAKLEQAGVDTLWMPAVSEVYPEGFATHVAVARLGDHLCGAARPGHFDGVATIVSKLFNQVRPDVAVFGEKDWQQLGIIRQLARDLDFEIEIVGAPILRDADGLALSSRNAYLSADERRQALALPQTLQRTVKALQAGSAVASALAEAVSSLTLSGFSPVDYVALVDAISLEPMERLDRNARLLAAAKLGKTRLIDNFPVAPPGDYPWAL